MPSRQSTLDDALVALQARLELRLADLSDDVAHYPTPIARCDEQLTKLIEQRTECLNRLRAVRAITESDAGATLDAIARLLRGLSHPDDDEEAALIMRLKSVAATSSQRRDATA